MGLQPTTFGHSVIMLYFQLWQVDSFIDKKTDAEGFEPSVLLKKHNGLASQRFKPLSHASYSPLRRENK